MTPLWERQLNRWENARFVDLALSYVQSVAMQQEFLTVDDVVNAWEFDGAPRDGTFSDPRVWGVVMRRAHRQGILIKTDHFKPSQNDTCHATPRRIWRSKVLAS
jgi:hypothetical protein